MPNENKPNLHVVSTYNDNAQKTLSLGERYYHSGAWKSDAWEAYDVEVSLGNLEDNADVKSAYLIAAEFVMGIFEREGLLKQYSLGGDIMLMLSCYLQEGQIAVARSFMDNVDVIAHKKPPYNLIDEEIKRKCVISSLICFAERYDYSDEHKRLKGYVAEYLNGLRDLVADMGAGFDRCPLELQLLFFEQSKINLRHNVKNMKEACNLPQAVFNLEYQSNEKYYLSLLASANANMQIYDNICDHSYGFEGFEEYQNFMDDLGCLTSELNEHCVSLMPNSQGDITPLR